MRYASVGKKEFEKLFEGKEGFSKKLFENKALKFTYYKYYYNDKQFKFYAKSGDEIILATSIYGTLSNRTIYSEVARVKNEEAKND